MDDEPFNLLSIKTVIHSVLKKKGLLAPAINQLFDVANDGADAVELVRQNNCFYRLIISDCQMPTLDGYQACLQIRQLYRDQNVTQPYIVACTGNVENSQVQRAWNSEFDELVQKPATCEVVEAILGQLMEH